MCDKLLYQTLPIPGRTEDGNSASITVTVLFNHPASSQYYLKQKSHSLILSGCSPQKSLSIKGNQTEVGIICSPHSHRAGAGRLGCVEHVFTPKQDVVESVGLAISSVAKDREDLDSSHISTTKFLHKIRLIADLKGDDAKPEKFTDTQWILSCMAVQ